MKLYIGDYLADTRHLSAEEHGAYLLLIMHMFRTGEIPSSDKQLAEITSCHPNRWRKIKSTIQKFFVVRPDGSWTHLRCEFEIQQARLLSAKRARYGSKGGLKRQENSLANATRLLPNISTCQKSESEVESYSSLDLPLSSDFSKRTHRAVADKKRIAYDEEFERIWREYPKREGAENKAQAFKKFKAALKAGAPLEAIAVGVKAHRKDCDSRKATGTPYVPMMSTWLNQQRWDDYAPTPAPPPRKPPTPEELAKRQEYIRLGERMLNGQGNHRPGETSLVLDGSPTRNEDGQLL